MASALHLQPDGDLSAVRVGGGTAVGVRIAFELFGARAWLSPWLDAGHLLGTPVRTSVCSTR